MEKKSVWVVDSLEENAAAVEQEGGSVYHVPRMLLPSDVVEGDVCRVDVRDEADSVSVTVTVDRKATDAAKQRSAAQVATPPKNRDPGGPINL